MSQKNPTRKLTTQIIIAGVLSVVAQALLLLTESIAARMSLSEQGCFVIGTVLFTIATIWIVTRAQSIQSRWHGGSQLILSQAIIFAGILLLLDTSASSARVGGFLLTSLNTTLTIYVIIANTTQLPTITGDNKKEHGANQNPRPDLHSNLEPIPYSPPELDISSNPLSTQASSDFEIMKAQAAYTNQKFNAEKQRTTQLTYLIELSRQLNNEMEPTVAAQLVINALERAIVCTAIALMIYETDKREFVTLATNGKSANVIQLNHRQSADEGIYKRLTRQKKTIVINSVSPDPDFIPINDENESSIIITPISSNGQLKGLLEIRSDKANSFSSTDVINMEGVATEIARAWGRSEQNQKLIELIQSGISLTTALDPQTAMQEIALLARKTFNARFVYVTLLRQQGDFSRAAYVGEAPRLLATLQKNFATEPFLQGILSATQPFRIHDLRKYAGNNNVEIDDPNLRSVLAIPMRLHRLNIGAILVFGKEDSVLFSQNDETLAGLLGPQAAASVESSWLYQELRSTLNITSMLRQLSEDVLMAEEIDNAAEAIAQTAYKATNASEIGILLITPEGDIQAKVELDASGLRANHQHPMDMINQTMETRQSILLAENQGTLACYPLLTRSHPVGAIWMRIPESVGQNFANFQLLANQAAVSLERLNLLAESRRQAREIEAAYEELEATYDQTLKALMSALDARDRETEGHSTRVSRLACLLGKKIGLNSEQLKALERGALLHDIGKIGISDTILHKPGKLSIDEWKIMRMHTDIGARIIEQIPFLQNSMNVVRYHHERWDGSGYPHGVKGEDIPVEARIFAVADVFDALTSRRSYREKSSADEALEYLREESNKLFDAKIVEALSQLPYNDFVEGCNSL